MIKASCADALVHKEVQVPGETFSGAPLSWQLSAGRAELLFACFPLQLSHLVLQNWWELRTWNSHGLVQSGIGDGPEMGRRHPHTEESS